MNSIILIGPTIWGNEHIECINQHNSVWLRYDSESPAYVRDKLNSMKLNGFKLYIYVPLLFDRGGKVKPSIPGSGKIEFEGIVDDHEMTDSDLMLAKDKLKTKLVGPIINQKNHTYYDQDNVLRWVDHFHVTKLYKLTPALDIEDFAIYTNNETSPYTVYERSNFAGTFAYRIALAHYPKSEVLK